MKQWRLDYTNQRGGGGLCFIDAESEAKALKFFAQAFPGCTLVSVELEPAKPCRQHERKAGL